MRTIPDVFDILGGTASAARALGLKTSTASEMKRRRTIPVKYWSAVVEQCKRRGKKLTYDALVRMHEK